jgi:hypothetical protein
MLDNTDLVHYIKRLKHIPIIIAWEKNKTGVQPVAPCNAFNKAGALI